MALYRTPTPVDMFSRFMADMYDEREVISVPTGFLAFFGNPASGGITHYSPDANDVDIDIIRGNKKTAALIPRGVIGRPLGSTHADMQGGKSTTFSRKFPLAEESGNIHANELLFRSPGEPSYNSGLSRLDRARRKARDLHMEGIRRSVRLFELLAMNSILYGTMPAILGTSNTDLIYDFKRKSTHKAVAVAGAWTGAVNPFTDIDSWCELVEQDGNETPDMLCLAGDSMSALIGNSTFQTLADNRRIEMIQVNQNMPVPPQFARFVNSGWIAQGRLRTPKGYTLWVFTYNRTYHNASGTSTALMPSGYGLVTYSGARCDRYFGPPESLPMTSERVQLYREYFGMDLTSPMLPPNIMGGGAVVEPAMFYCDMYKSGDEKSLTIRTQSAPIFVPVQTDCYVTGTGIAG